LNQITELDEEIGCQSAVRTHKILAIGGRLDEEAQPFPHQAHLAAELILTAINKMGGGGKERNGNENLRNKKGT
jgi:hypothetical protein